MNAEEELAAFEAQVAAKRAELLEAKKLEAAKAAVNGKALTQAEIASAIAAYDEAAGRESPHPALAHLAALVSHLLAVSPKPSPTTTAEAIPSPG